MSDLAFYCFQYALALLLAPLLPGIIARIKAKVAGRHGKPVLQLYFDIFKGLRKGEVISQVTTPVFTLGPVVGLATVLCALALLPLGGMASPLRFSGDFLLAAYLLGLGRFLTMLAALDTGSSFEGMGASREAAFSALSEPVLKLVEDGTLSAGHARALLPLNDPEMQLAAAKTVIEKGLSVRRAEALAAQLLKDTQEKPAKKAAGVDYLGECARHLEQVLGRKVRMTQGRKTGRIELEYYDADDREALLQALEAIGRRN